MTQVPQVRYDNAGATGGRDGKQAVRTLLAGGGLALLAAGAFAQAPANYVLAWSDNFAGIPTSGAGAPALDTSKWWYRMQATSNGTQQAANISLDGAGNLNIANTAASSSGPYFGGGVISKQTFRYGYYQVTAKLPANPQSNYHTAFWTRGGYREVVSWDPAAPPAADTEIDGFEIDSNNTTAISTGWHAWAGSTHLAGARCTSAYHPAFDPSAAPHTYAFEWTEDGISYFIDGVAICSKQLVDSTQAVATPVNIWLTSIPYGASGTPATGAKASFSAVKYYVRDYYVNAGDPGYAEYGSGWSASSLQGFSSQPMRWSATAGNYATYTPNLLAAGTYNVQVYVVIAGGMDTAPTVTVNTSGGVVTVPAGTLPTTGSSRWVSLGTWSFDAGTAANVKFKVGNNNLRLSMVKFVRQ